MRIRTTFFAVVVLVLACPALVRAQGSGRIETRTRLVSQFSEIQKQWLDAVKRKDSAALNRILSEDYEVWTPAHDGPIPREDWQARAFAENLKDFHVTGMAVKALPGGGAVESFRLTETMSQSTGDITQHFFVVNVWTSEKDGWRCTDSYVSPVAEQAAAQTAPDKSNGKD
jgi:ketosteroid isomerase-like protein